MKLSSPGAARHPAGGTMKFNPTKELRLPGQQPRKRHRTILITAWE
jgi:hypothetical protein